MNRIHNTILRLDAHFNGLGGGALLDVATGYLWRLRHALDNCRYGERIERAMHRAVAEVAACAGWSAHDCGRFDLAAQLRNEALQAALLARDSIAISRAWSDLAVQAENARRPGEAARINRAALTERHMKTEPLLASLLHARLADCLAQTGDPVGMGRHLAAAERTYDRATPVDAPSWLGFLTEAELSGLTAIAHQSAGHLGKAEQQVTQTLDLLDSRFSRNRAYYTVQLAQAEPERAAATAATAQQPAISSSRIAGRLESLMAAIDQQSGDHL